MIDRDILAELRAWRDEFAKSHGYDMAAMVAPLRERERAAGTKVIRGEARPPVATEVKPEQRTRLQSM
jgi:hypothetical protein